MPVILDRLILLNHKTENLTNVKLAVHYSEQNFEMLLETDVHLKTLLIACSFMSIATVAQNNYKRQMESEPLLGVTFDFRYFTNIML